MKKIISSVLNIISKLKRSAPKTDEQPIDLKWNITDIARFAIKKLKQGISPAIVKHNELDFDAKEIISTLWYYQNKAFKDDYSRRFTFKPIPGITDYLREYLLGVTDLHQNNLISFDANYGCLLTDVGIEYCKNNQNLLISDYDRLRFKLPNVPEFTNVPMLTPKFVVDACVFIAALDSDEPHYENSLLFFNTIRDKKYRLFAPVIMPLEVENNFRKKKRSFAIKELTMKGNLQFIVVYMDEQFFRSYKKTMLDLPYTGTLDILYATIAKHNNAPLITWNKKHFIKYGKEIEILTPKEFMASSYV
jgi:predicted nucleic acid-binding protein